MKPLTVKKNGPPVFTIGHSTRTLTEFARLLEAYGITRVIDVRSIPRSRHNPQFNKETLPAELRLKNIGYVHLPALGGLRRAAKDSVNMGWDNASFRGYADYMQTPEFSAAVVELMDHLAGTGKAALLCAEAVPWRCHRSLIADALLVRGIEVFHILGLRSARRHTIIPFARVCGTKITYPRAAEAVSK